MALGPSRRHISLLAALPVALACSGTGGAQHPVAWHDASPHTARFVRTRDGTRLHVLDWGGTGPAVVLLAGLGSSAHTFDDLIPHLDSRFHYFAITRRGTGESDHPATGYDVATRVTDDLDALDALGVRRCVLIGHSIAGTELSVLGTTHPAIVRGMVYLEAAYDRGDRSHALGPGPALHDPPMPAVLTFSQLLSRQKVSALGLPPALRSDLEVTQHGGDDSLISSPSLPVRQAMLSADSAYRADYRLIEAPLLAVFAFSPHHPSDAVFRLTDSTRAVLDAWWQKMDWPWRRAQVEKFQREARHATVLVLNPAEHLVYMSNTAEVERGINAFLAPLANDANH